MRISHPVFGPGEILANRKSSAGPQIECLVQFDSGLRLWVPASRIEGVSEEFFQEFKAETGLKDKEIKIKAHRMVEAFRLGIVPTQDVTDFTFGRTKEIHLINSALNKLIAGQGNAIIFEGEYGAGKTHLLEYIRAQALTKNFLVSMVELSLDETQPARPKRIYRELIANLRYLPQDQKDNHCEAGFRNLMRYAIKEYRSPNYLGIRDHIFFAPVLSRLSKIDQDSPKAEVFWQWIEAESTKEYATGITPKGKKNFTIPYRISGAYNIPALYDFSTAADFYCYLISGLAYLARSLKYNGLVLLLDEIETVTFLWGHFYYDRGINFIEGLIRMSQNDPMLKTIDSRLIHNQVRPTPYIYKDAYVLLVLATTPEPLTLRLKQLCKNVVSLYPLQREDFRNCFETLVKYYKIAYPDFVLSEQTKQQILNNALRQADNGIRYFIKFGVESLDVLRINRKSTGKKLIGFG